MARSPHVRPRLAPPCNYRSALLRIALLSTIAHACGGDTPPPILPPSDDLTLLQSQEVGFGANGQFQVGHDGSANYAIPLLVPTGRRGVQPDLSLVYNSNRPDVGVGVGWAVTGASAIARCRRTALLDGSPGRVAFDDMDALCLDGRRLVHVDGSDEARNGARYRPQRDGYELVTLHGDLSDAESWFEVRLSDGTLLEYGHSADANSLVRGLRFDSAEDGRAEWIEGEVTKRWLVSRREDLTGNFMTYSYGHDSITTETERIGYETYLSEIRYTGHASLGEGERFVAFEYAPALPVEAERQDQFVNGFWEYSSQALVRVSMHAPGDTPTVRSYELEYDASPHTRRRMLSSVTLCDGRGACLTPVGFSYTTNATAAVDFDVEDLGPVPYGWYSDLTAGETNGSRCSRAFGQTFVLADIDGSGRDDLLYFEQVEPCAGGFLGSYEYRLRRNSGVGIRSGLGPAVHAAIPSTIGTYGFPPELPPLAAIDIDTDGRVDIFDRRTMPDQVGVRYIRREWDPVSGRLQVMNPDVFGCAAPASGPLNSYVGGRTGVLDTMLVGDVDGNGAPDLMAGCDPECLAEGASCTSSTQCCSGMTCGEGLCLRPSLNTCSSVGDACGLVHSCCPGLDCVGSAPLVDGACEIPLPRVDWRLRLQANTTGSGHDTFGPATLFFEGDPSSSTAILADVDGRGVMGLLLAQNTDAPATHYVAGSVDIASSSVVFTPTNIPVPPRPTLVYVDMNGDGLRDLLDLAGEDGAQIQLNSGRGFIEPMDAYLPLPTPSVFIADSYRGRLASDVRVGDFNGDGREDFLLLSEGRPDVAGDSFYVMHYGTDAGFARFLRLGFDAEPIYIPPGSGAPGFRSWNTVQVGHLNGDGALDIVAANHTSLTGHYNRHVQPDLLETVSLADAPYREAAFVRVGYAAVNNGQRIRSRPAGQPSRELYRAGSRSWPQRALRRGLTVVERHSEVATADDSFSHPVHRANLEALVSAHFEYTYTGGTFDTRDGSFLGFSHRRVLRWEAIPVEFPSPEHVWTRRDWMETRFTFDLETRGPDGRAAFAGMPRFVERHVTHLVDGRYHADRTSFDMEAVAAPALDSSGAIPIVFRRVRSVRREEYDLPEAPAPSSSGLAGNPDYARRVTRHVSYDDYSIPVRWVRVVEGGEHETVTAVPDRDLSINLLQRYGQTTTTSGFGPSRETRYDFDPVTALVARMTINPDDPQRERVSEFTHSATGLVERIDESAWDPDTPADSDPVLRRTARIIYDADETFPTAIGIDVHGTTLWSSWQFHPALGVVQRSSGPNGAITEIRHDGFGRVRRVSSPDGAQMTFDYAPPGHAYDQVTIQRRGNDGSEAEVTLDAFGRARRSRVLGDRAGVYWVHSSRFDTRGMLTEASVPYAETDGPRTAHRYVRDDLGRLVEAIAPDGASTLLQHGAVDPDSGAHDPRRVEIRTPGGDTYVQLLDADLRLRQVIEPGDVRTTYTYGAFGLPRRVELPQGAFREYTYDSNGLLHTVEDSAVGLRTAERDGFGQVFRMTRADGSTTELRHDGAGRLVRRTSADGSARFVYDTGRNGRGRLTFSVGEDGTTEAFAYNGAGRSSEVAVSVPGVGTARTQYGYDRTTGALSRVRTGGPAGGRTSGVELLYGYRNGYLTEVSSPGIGTLWRAIAHHPQGFVATEEFPLAPGTGGLRVERDLDATDRRVSIRSSVQSLEVELDEDGDVTSVADGILAQRFSYDARGRLASWTVNESPPVGYRYDDLGNVEQNESATLTYDPSTHLLATVDGAAVRHDPRGRVEQIAGRDITSWRDFDLFDEVQDSASGETVSFAYTAGQRRAGWRSSTGRSSIQIGDAYRREQEEGGAVTETFAVPGATRTVAELVSRDGATPELRFIHDDHLGSTAAVTTPDGDERRFWHSPFGRRVDPETGAFLDASEDPDVQPRFTTHQADAQAPALGSYGAGFLHMRGREYDPVAGRFLTQDPFTPVGIAAGGWNPYAYVLNNPATLIDPSGFGPFDTLRDSTAAVAVSSAGNLNQGYVIDLLARAWASRPAVSHAQPDIAVQWDRGFLMGIGLDFGLQNGPYLTTPPDARLAYYQGQLVGSAVGVAADLLVVASGLAILWSGELPPFLGGLLGGVFGPGGTAGGVAAGTMVSIPAFVVGAGLSMVGAAFLPGHTSRLQDAIDNLRRMEGGTGPRGVRIGQRQAEEIVRSSGRPAGSGNVSQAARKLQRRQGDPSSLGTFDGILPRNAQSLVRNILENATSRQFGRLQILGYEGERGIAFFNDAGQGVLVRASDNTFITFLEQSRGLAGIFR